METCYVNIMYDSRNSGLISICLGSRPSFTLTCFIFSVIFFYDISIFFKKIYTKLKLNNKWSTNILRHIQCILNHKDILHNLVINSECWFLANKVYVLSFIACKPKFWITVNIFYTFHYKTRLLGTVTGHSYLTLIDKR